MRLPASLLLLLAALAAAGCGNDGGGKSTGGAATLGKGETLDVTAREYSFTPAAIVLKGSGELRIHLRNDGSLAHDVRLRRDGREVGGTDSIPPGKTADATVKVAPGRYELLCTVGDHAELGMTGELQVKE